MAATDVRKNFSLNVDGRGYAGKVDEFNAPKLTQKTEEFRAGGMNAPLDLNMGMEKLTCDFSLISFDRDLFALFGLVDGAQVGLTAREALESYDGTVKSVMYNMRGKVVGIDPGTSKAGDQASMKFDISLSYYKMTHSGRVIHEIDVENMIHFVNGVDVLAQHRAALGM